jgi:hypothetical protein
MTSAAVLTTLKLDSGFKPGVDDWQFVNRGSFATPSGQCAGMSISAIWYYYTHAEKDGHLYRKYDNDGPPNAKTPAVWVDDSRAYRFTAEVQDATDWSSLLNRLSFALEGTSGTLQMSAFAYALHVTHMPQLVGLTDSKKKAGHAVVGYKIEDGSIWVADPNFPGEKSKESKIEYVNGDFKPYRSALSAEDEPLDFDKIGYYAVTATVEWETIAWLFEGIADGTAGDSVFPEYTVWADSASAKLVELFDGVVFEDPFFKLSASDPPVGFSVYKDGAPVTATADGYPLAPGKNQYGIALYGKVDGKNKYLDYMRLNIIYEPKQPSNGFDAPLVYSLSPGVRVANPLNLQVSGEVQGPAGMLAIIRPQAQPQLVDVFVSTRDAVTLNYNLSAGLKNGTSWHEDHNVGEFGDYKTATAADVVLSNPRVRVISGGTTLAELGATSGSYQVPAATGTRQVNVQFRLEWDFTETLFDVKGVEVGKQTGTTGVYFLHFVVDAS